MDAAGFWPARVIVMVWLPGARPVLVNAASWKLPLEE